MLDADVAELQPADGRPVRVSFRAAEVADPNLDVSVYHVSDGEADELAVSESGSTATARTDGFSFYTVEFTYGELTYVMDGDTTVPLADVLARVGLVGEPTAVSVSDPDLFSVSDETGQWTLTAHFWKVSLGEIGEQKYIGAPITPTGLNVLLIGVDAELVEGTDYQLSYAYDLPASKGTVTATFVKDFKGKASEDFEIKRQPLTVTAKSAKQAYNGEALTCPGYDADGLVGADKISSVQVAGSQTDVGESASAVEGVKVVSASGEDADVTGYYDITLVPGKLEVTPAKATIAVDSASKVEDEDAPLAAGINCMLVAGLSAAALLALCAVAVYVVRRRRA